MIRYGSCNAYAWAIHPRSTPFRTGDNANRTDAIAEIGVEIVRNTSGYPYVMKGGVGQRWDHFSLVSWEYPSGPQAEPEIWIVRNSSNEVTHVWEAETRFDINRQRNLNPIITTMQTRQSIIPAGGSTVQIEFPSYSTLVNVENLVSYSSMPAWITNSRYGYINDTPTLLSTLFKESLRKHAMAVYSDLESVISYSRPTRFTNLYFLLWMREASKIIFDYRGVSCIELFRSNFRVDSDGLVSYSA